MHLLQHRRQLSFFNPNPTRKIGTKSPPPLTYPPAITTPTTMLTSAPWKKIYSVTDSQTETTGKTLTPTRSSR
ncbi:hypothetical protein B0H34DRAFT_686967, partial [Crassisporium funariophilum]